MINIGDRVKDKVTGFEGIVVAETNWLNGCTRCGVQSLTLKDGIPIDLVWFDRPQLELMTSRVVAPGVRTTGGPLPSNPQKAADPK